MACGKGFGIRRLLHVMGVRNLTILDRVIEPWIRQKLHTAQRLKFYLSCIHSEKVNNFIIVPDWLISPLYFEELAFLPLPLSILATKHKFRQSTFLPCYSTHLLSTITSVPAHFSAWQCRPFPICTLIALLWQWRFPQRLLWHFQKRFRVDSKS